MLMNAAARNRPVTGSFYIASLDLALAQLQHAFDLEARSLPGGVIVLS
jgi:transmembrane sensor